MMKLLDYIVEWWLKRCPHDDRNVCYDLLEADGNGIVVNYCRRCGAVRRAFTGSTEWRRPQPLWYPAKELSSMQKAQGMGIPYGYYMVEDADGERLVKKSGREFWFIFNRLRVFKLRNSWYWLPTHFSKLDLCYTMAWLCFEINWFRVDYKKTHRTDGA